MKEIVEIFNRGLSLLANNRVKEGQSELEKLIIYDRYNVNALNFLALCEYLYCNFNNAKVYIDTSLTIDKKNEKTLKYKKLIYSAFKSNLVNKYEDIIKKLKSENVEQVINELDIINRDNDELIEPYILLAIIYMKKRKYIKARKYIKEAYKRDKSNYFINDIYLKLKV